MKSPQRYADPYIAGAGLGLVLLACFALTGQGLGASGAFASMASGIADVVAPEAAVRNGYFQRYLEDGSPWTAWIVIEVVGVLIGAAVSSALAGRLKANLGAVAPVSPARLAGGLGGGILMGAGAALARGCTSGLALSGGAMLSVGAWAFMIALFAGGFALAPLVRRLWA